MIKSQDCCSIFPTRRDNTRLNIYLENWISGNQHMSAGFQLRFNRARKASKEFLYVAFLFVAQNREARERTALFPIEFWRQAPNPALARPEFCDLTFAELNNSVWWVRAYGIN